MISRIDHVAIAVRDYQAARDFFTTVLDIQPGVSATEESLGFSWHVFSAGDLSRLELLAPEGEKSFLDSFLATKEGGVHHITCQTDDIECARAHLERHSIPYFGYNGDNPSWKELFIHPKDAFGVLIQIAEFSAEEYIDPCQKLPDGKKWQVARKSEQYSLSITHPGGGKAEISLDRTEVEKLIGELKNIL